MAFLGISKLRHHELTGAIASSQHDKAVACSIHAMWQGSPHEAGMMGAEVYDAFVGCRPEILRLR